MSKQYRNGEYIYPCRPEYKINPDLLDKFDDGSYLVEAKYNGSCCELYIKPDKYKVFNRHKSSLSNFKLSEIEILNLHRGDGEMLLIGEYMNKLKKDKNNKIFNHKFIIVDILVFNNQHLIGTTYQERLNILHEIYDLKDYDEYLYQIYDNIFITKSFEQDFKNLYENIVKIDMLEGLVLKPKNSKLSTGTKKLNNLSMKCRKETKNYQF